MELAVTSPSDGLRGTLEVAADKSISHRALLLAALAHGTTRITHHLHSADVSATWQALAALGVSLRHENHDVVVDGVGLSGFSAPSAPIDCQNSGTTMRILAGILAGQRLTAELIGDESLSRRPMKRIIEPLRAMGASIGGALGDVPPLRIEGRRLRGVGHTLDVASAQVKSCLLLAGLHAEGVTTVTEPAASRDHTERMLRHFGVCVASHGLTHSIEGGQQLEARDVTVCADLSSAAFLLVGALIVPDSELVLRGVGVNPTRAGVLEALRDMGACIEKDNEREVSGEPVADLTARTSGLDGVTLGGEMIPGLVDEVPIIAVAATQAEGTTVIRDAAELRVKETDRIAGLTLELRKMGASIEERPDGMVIEGPTPLHGTGVQSHGDHRIAMALAIAGLVAQGETRVCGAECIDVSYPGFAQALIKASGPVGS